MDLFYEQDNYDSVLQENFVISDNNMISEIKRLRVLNVLRLGSECLIQQIFFKENL